MSRDDLVTTNETIVTAVTREAVRRSPKAVLVIVSNPLDAMCHVAKAVSRFPKSRVVGMAGILDTARFSTFIAWETRASVKDVTATVLGGHGDQMVPVVSATKGIEEGTLKLMSQVMEDTLPAGMRRSLTVLSGPSFALEVCQKKPTVVSLAGKDPELVRRLQALLITPFFRVYTGSDLLGVELGGALKNVMALAAGAVDGLGLGHNARAALISRGLVEMIGLGTAMGAEAETFYGPSGLGDLVLTCTGPLSRNHTVGVRIGKGETLQDILRETHTVAEGVKTARAALGLANRFGVEMPIVREVCAVLFEGKSPLQAVTDLMLRAAKDDLVEKDSNPKPDS